jgi:hypothetical protein
MMTEVKEDCLLGRSVKPSDVKPVVDQTLDYYEPTVGRVRVTMAAYTELRNSAQPNYMFAGIMRNAFEDKKEPPLVDSHFIRAGYKEHNPPVDFKEKVKHLLRYLYDHGGRENHKFELNSSRDFPIAYAEPAEFIRLVEQLEKEHWIQIGKTHQIGPGGRMRVYMNLELTTWGIDEVEKTLPQIPMAGLVDQRITTGDTDVDDKINHAKSLFFKDGSTMDDKRSACETLSYVLEPLRKELEAFFSTSDVSDFFQLVNRFDVRHNKSSTINLVHEEQLEWVFYTLLNSISTFTKLKRKIS